MVTAKEIGMEFAVDRTVRDKLPWKWIAIAGTAMRDVGLTETGNPVEDLRGKRLPPGISVSGMTPIGYRHYG